MYVRWHTRSSLQSILALFPVSVGEALYYFAQRHIAHSLPSSLAKLREYESFAICHLALLRKGGAVNDARFYEFGAGRELTIPLVFHAQGIKHQLVTDIVPLAKSNLVDNVARKLAIPTSWWDAIEYSAPLNPSRTMLGSCSVDCITTTNVLEHIPVVDILPILWECRRLLRERGLMSFRIDYDDHYAKSDTSITPYNFLHYTDAQWQKYNSRFLYQNRLRHSDYRVLFERAGFEILEELPDRDKGEGLGFGNALSLAPQFLHYSQDDLRIHNSFWLLRKGD